MWFLFWRHFFGTQCICRLPAVMRVYCEKTVPDGTSRLPWWHRRASAVNSHIEHRCTNKSSAFNLKTSSLLTRKGSDLTRSINWFFARIYLRWSGCNDQGFCTKVCIRRQVQYGGAAVSVMLRYHGSTPWPRRYWYREESTAMPR